MSFRSDRDWTRRKDERANRAHRMRSAIHECRVGNYENLSMLQDYVRMFTLSTLTENYRVKPDDYEKWIQNSQK